MDPPAQLSSQLRFPHQGGAPMITCFITTNYFDMSTINPTNCEFNWSYVQRFFVSPGAAPFGLRLQGRFWGRGPKSGRLPAGNDPISRVPRHLLRQRHDFMAIFFRKT